MMGPPDDFPRQWSIVLARFYAITFGILTAVVRLRLRWAATLLVAALALASGLKVTLDGKGQFDAAMTGRRGRPRSRL